MGWGRKWGEASEFPFQPTLLLYMKTGRQSEDPTAGKGRQGEGTLGVANGHRVALWHFASPGHMSGPAQLLILAGSDGRRRALSFGIWGSNCDFLFHMVNFPFTVLSNGQSECIICNLELDLPMYFFLRRFSREGEFYFGLGKGDFALRLASFPQSKQSHCSGISPTGRDT